jgi:hypothetical protein
MAAEDKESGSEPQINLDKAKFDLEKWQIEEEIKLRRDELDLKRKDLSKSRWSSPLLIAVIGLFTTILLSIIQNSCQSTATRELERQRFESTLIQKALDSSSRKEAAERFKSYLALGLIRDETIRTQIQKYISEPETIPLSNAPAEDVFLGTDRNAAKLSTGSGPVEKFNDLKDLIDSLPPENTMTSHVPPITNDINSGRVSEEQRNVQVSAFLYAASLESDNDFHLIVGRDPKATPEIYMSMELSGLPPSTSASFKELEAARDSFKKFYDDKANLPGHTYDFYDPPIPVEISGSLFFDMTQKGRQVGPKSLKSHMPVIWEVHPITKMVFK